MVVMIITTFFITLFETPFVDTLHVRWTYDLRSVCQHNLFCAIPFNSNQDNPNLLPSDFLFDSCVCVFVNLFGFGPC